MGYRSEVVFIVAKEVMPQFLATMAKSPEARKMCFSETDKRIKSQRSLSCRATRTRRGRSFSGENVHSLET